MSDYFLSDVHLRSDRPERGQRLARFAERLKPDDRLVIVGDLCDFWMGSRESNEQLIQSPGIQALAAFRQAGGTLEILAGNHDHWLCPFYEQRLGATIASEPYSLVSNGLRLHLVHGHLLGARRKWKSFLESREFFGGFGLVPSPVARGLDAVLEAKNQRGLADDEHRHMAVYREYAARLRDQADVVVFGHVHRAIDEPGPPRLIVLGGWQHRISFLKIDAAGASFTIESGGPDKSPAASGSSTSPSPHQPSRTAT
ncbi:UDP-2,3-diacylglucosamine diphosphatase [Paludisphaera borealis]|uniref:UDP-2,3-diacylglucosamine hydrolase n=1 Tax=Paludisphaera borealis TaxID=1387353 RepID=A0A1U7CVF7_9BACT|nr:UDP-2,3-diacylglucosamine diphosphatase [Paludisphaera borealis]APW62886.1 UDP-2,3-diacylglucosamine hydrolase [Paludisphaera borealis]